MRVDRQSLPAEPTSARLFGLRVAGLALALTSALAGCARSPVASSRPSSSAAPAAPAASAASAAASDGGAATDGASPAGPRARAEAQIDPDGNDDPEDLGEGRAPSSGRFEKVGTPPLALTRICDLTPFGDALYMAHAHQPLGVDGATITRYRPSDDKRPFTVAFDWNRIGEPTKGGGAGQGFARVHAIDGRLFVADNDPPYNGLGLVEYGTEGYVFVSDKDGAFAPPRAPHYRPPGPPDLLSADGHGGAGVLPRAYHVLDVVRFRGAYFASTGSVPPKERAWRGPSPGAMHRANADGSRWIYETDYPYPYQDGVWRLTFLVRFKDRLYAGIQDYDGRDPNDYLYYAPAPPVKSAPSPPPAEATESDAGPPPILRREDVHPVRVTPRGAAGTLRWWVDTRASPPRLYWIAWASDGVRLRTTTDGDTWTVVTLPDGAGRPTDVTRFRDAVVVLAERGLYRLDGDTAAPLATPIAAIDDRKSPFEVGDFFCVAPLAVFENKLYAGGQRGGTLYRLDETP